MRRLLKVGKGVCVVASAVFIATTALLPLLAPRRRLDATGAPSLRVHSADYLPVSDYCNFPDETRISEEGIIGRAAPAQSLELVSVTVVMRHGDRFHMTESQLGDLPQPAASCRMAAPALADGIGDGGDTIHVQRFIDDMDRMVAAGSPWPLPPYPNSSTCTPGRMSPTGVRQQLRSGQQLRSAYAGAKINISSVRAISTPFERTYQSALAFLHGLNPRLDWTRLRIERASDTRFCSPGAAGIGRSCTCPHAEVLGHEARANVRTALKARDRAYAAFAERASSVLGRRAVSAAPYPWEAAFDFLSQFACRRLRPPCSSSRGGGACFLDEDVSLLWQHVQLYNRKLHAEPAFVRKCRIEAHPLLSAIGKRLMSFARPRGAESGSAAPSSAADNRDADARVLLYSGHDVTLTPLAVALGVSPVSGWPPYASRLVFEQYSRSDNGGSPAGQQRQRSRHYIRLLYNGVDVTRHMNFCSAGASAKVVGTSVPAALCTLDEFMSFASHRNLDELGYRSWQDACRGRIQRGVTSRKSPIGDVV